MNAKFRFICRVVGMLLLAAGVVKMTTDAIRSATFEAVPAFAGFVGSFRLSLEGIAPVLAGCLLIYFGYRAPRKPAP